MTKQIRNSDCTKCSLHEGCDFVCEMFMYDEPMQGGLMVIGDYPTNPDPVEVRIMSDTKFDLFWKIAEEVCHVDRKQVYATYSTKCKPAEGVRPSDSQNITCASTYLKKEILAIKPKAILLLGSLPASAFGLTQPITKLRGTTKQVTLGKDDNKFTTTLVVAQSPGYVQYNSTELKHFAEDIYKAWQIANGGSVDTKESPTKVTMCTTIEQVEKVIGYILQTKECTFDFETNKLTDMGVFAPEFKATLLALSFQHGSAYTIPLFHFDTPFSEAEVMYILGRLSEDVWANPDIHKINQNIKFDMHVAAHYGFPSFRGRISCTMVMHSLYDDLTKHGIKEWLPTFLPEFNGWELEVKGQQWDKIPLNTLSQYAGVDADGAFRGFTVLEQKLLEDERVYDLFRNLYMFALRPLYNMERRGMLMSRESLLKYEARALDLIQQQTAKMNKYAQVIAFNAYMRDKVTLDKLTELRTKKKECPETHVARRTKYAQQIADIKQGKVEVYKDINYGSPQQLCELLYSQYGFYFKAPYDKKSRGQKEVTGEVAIKSLKDKTGFVQDLLILRSLQGTYSKYLLGLRELLDETDHIHTTYSQSRVKTGRLSSQSPNLQNITTHVKIKDPLIEEIIPLPKKCFIVPDGHDMLNNDASQAELRMIAELSGDENMIAVFTDDTKDIHIETARAINNITQEEWDLLPEKPDRKEIRQKGKAANFGLIFDQSPEGFRDYAFNSYGVKLTQEEANKIHEGFFIQYPRIREYHENYRAKGRKFGYVRSLFGRKGHYPDINSHDQFLRGNAERELVNFPVQSSNAEITLFALALLEYRLPENVKLLNSVHDSIMLDSPNKFTNYAAKVSRDTWENLPMERFFGKGMEKLKMKIDTESSNQSWKDLAKYEIK